MVSTRPIRGATLGGMGGFMVWWLGVDVVRHSQPMLDRRMARMAHRHRFRNPSPKALNNVRSKLRATADNPVVLPMASANELPAILHIFVCDEFF